MKRLGLPFQYRMNNAGNSREAVVESGHPMQFVYMAQDFHRRDENGVLWMEDRGQSLPVHKGMVRATPCFMPFIQMQIEWDGQLLPCCQIQPDIFTKDKYSLGRIDASSDIFVEWTNVNYVQWRRDLFSYEIKKSPCATCNYGGWAEDTPELRAVVANLREDLDLDVDPPAPSLLESAVA